jgi:putative FmdB family regulatory protein
MPIFEFKCSKCEAFFEVIAMNSKDDEAVNCPKCNSNEFERVVSMTNFKMAGPSSSSQKGISTQTRECSSGNCTTYTVPGDS